MVCEIVLTTHGKLKFLYVCLEQLQEQIKWAVESGADYIVAETFSDYAEAELALQCIKLYGNGCTMTKWETFQILEIFIFYNCIWKKQNFVIR